MNTTAKLQQDSLYKNLAHHHLDGVARLIFLLLVVVTVGGESVYANQLQNLTYSVLPGNAVQVALDFDAPAPVPVSFTTDNPARIVLDFPGTVTASSAPRSVEVGIGNVQSVSAVQGGGRTRVVIGLLRAGAFVMDSQDKRLLLSIGVGDSGQTAASMGGGRAAAVKAALSGRRARAAAGQASIDGIDFRRSESGAAQIIVTFTNDNVAIDMDEQGKDIVVRFKQVRLPEKFDRRLDVSDFATPVITIDTSREGGDALMRIKAAGEFEHLAYQADNEYTVELKQVVPKLKKEELPIAEKKYSGERLSLNFHKIEIHSVLNLLADFQGKNLVMTSAVKGNVTLRLDSVPWDQALDIILDMNHLGIREIGNVWHIDTNKNIEARRKEELESQREIKKLEPLKTEFITINYATAEEFAALLRTSGSGEEASHSFLSDRGNVAVNSRTNTLLIQDTAAHIEDIRRLIMQLDQPVRQVLITSRVVTADESFSRDLGVRFGQSTNFSFGDNRDWGMMTGGTIGAPLATGAATTALTDGMILDLPAAGNIGLGLAIGKVGTYMLQLELSALESEGRGEVISSPRIITADQQAATIEQGVEIAVPGTPGANAAATTQYKKAVLSLNVTPRITPDDRVLMDLNVKKDAPAGGQNVNTRSLTTQVLVSNGETVVLGGVFEQNDTNAVDRVPFLGDLPVLGKLFTHNRKNTTKSELLIFVTPKILKEVTS